MHLIFSNGFVFFLCVYLTKQALLEIMNLKHLRLNKSHLNQDFFLKGEVNSI